LKSCPVKVGDLITSKANLDLVGVVTSFALNQDVFWVRWLDREINTIYTTRDFDTMFHIVARA
jgi:hypothetical protein